MKPLIARCMCAAMAMICILGMQTSALAQHTEDLFDLEHSLSFARFLEDQRRFDLAIDEYQRIDQSYPGRLEVRMALLHLFALTGRPTEGIVAYEKWAYQPIQAPAELRRKYVGLHFQNRDFERLRARLGDGIGLKEPEKTRIDLHLALYQGDWQRSQKLFETFEIQHVHASRLTFAPLLESINRMHYRKPWLGSGLSVVPGLGQMYAGQWINGLTSLFLVGVTGFEAYRLFHKRGFGNILGWGLVGISGSFYIANIYGGQRAVKRYNEKQDAKLRQALDGVAARYF